MEVAVYNLGGQKIATLVSGPRQAGIHTLSWDGLDHKGRELASGVYMYEFHVGGQIVETRKMTMVK